MVKATILVTGASGKSGFAVVSRLREEGYPVRAVVRRRDDRGAALERLGAEVRVADMFDVEQLTAAARGTQRAYFVPPYDPAMIHSAVAFAQAARTAKVEVIVGMSQWLASPSHPSLLTRQHWLADQMFQGLPGVGYIKLDPGYFADNYFRFVDFASLLGILPNLTGDSRNAPPSNEDIGRVAAALLMRPGGHVGTSVRPTGPTLVSSHDVADALTRALGRKVRTVPMPIWILTKAARRQGVRAFDLLSLASYVRDHEQGAFALGAPNRVVQELTGRPAEDLDTIARRYASWPKARRTIGSIARAWLGFLLTPLMPGYDLAAYERGVGIARPADARLAMDDLRWRAERGAVGEAPRPTQQAIRPLISA